MGADRKPPPRIALSLYAPAAAVFSLAYVYTPDTYYAPDFVSHASEWVVRPVVGWILLVVGIALGVAAYRAPEKLAFLVAGAMILFPLAAALLSIQGH